jgi:hypothetical protein
MSTIRTAVCFLFWRFSRTLLISQSNASVVFRPARDPCWPGCPHPLISPWFARCKVIAFSTTLPIVGSRDMHRDDFTLVRSRRPGFTITTTLATLNSGGRPVLINSLIIWQRPLGSNLNQIFSSRYPIPSSPGAEVLQVLFRSCFNIFGHPVKAVP